MAGKYTQRPVGTQGYRIQKSAGGPKIRLRSKAEQCYAQMYSSAMAPPLHFATVTIRAPLSNSPMTHVQSPDSNLIGCDVIWGGVPPPFCSTYMTSWPRCAPRCRGSWAVLASPLGHRRCDGERRRPSNRRYSSPRSQDHPCLEDCCQLRRRSRVINRSRSTYTPRAGTWAWPNGTLGITTTATRC